MRSISMMLHQSWWLYTLFSAINQLMLLVTCFAATTALFRVRPRRQWYLHLTAAVLIAAVGVWRPWANAGDLDQVQLWNVISTLLPFVCYCFLYPKKAIWKAALVTIGYTFVEAIKYIVLLLFFEYDNDNIDDPLEVTVELVVGAVVLALVLWLLRRRGRTDARMVSVTRTGATLYLLVVATLVMFIASLALLGSNYSEEDRAKFMILMLNLPLFAATVAYAVRSLSKSRLQEKTYRQLLLQQIQHYEMMEQMNEDLRAFRHDLPKKLRPLSAYLENNQPEQAKEIVDQLSDFMADSSARFYTGNSRLDTVLFCQQQLAEKYNVKIVFTFGSVFPNEGIDPDDIYTIFPNALDNALEACRKTGQPCEIVMTSRIKEDEVFVTIENPVVGEVISQNGVPQTDKTDRKTHGYGFRSMRKAAAKYGRDNLDFLVKDGKFILRMNLKFKHPDET